MVVQTGRGGMGNHKHGVSGKGGPSPKTKFMTCFDANREAQRNQKVRPQREMWPTIRAAMEGNKKGTR